VVGDLVGVEHVNELVVVWLMLIVRKESRFPAPRSSSELILLGLTLASKTDKMKCLAVPFVAG
jgi:hypothetical protein